MKFISFTILAFCILCSVRTFAQSTVKTGTRFAILGGINFQNQNGKDSDGLKLENKIVVSFHAGVNIQIPIAPEFYFQPGLLFSGKGSKSTSANVSTKYMLSYIELPLNLVYKSVLGSGNFMLGFGPYLAYAVKGKAISKGPSGTGTSEIKFKNNVESNDPEPFSNFKAFDAGGNIFAGYEMSNGIFFQLNTQLGMVKVNSENKNIANNRTSVKNTGFGLSLGFRF